MQNIKSVTILPQADTHSRTGTLQQGSGRNVETCKSCGGQKWFSYSGLDLGHPFYGRLFPCPGCIKQAMDFACGLKEHERGISLDCIDPEGRPGTKRMVEAAKAFISNPVGFLSVHGGFGNGKTTALMSIVNAVIANGIEARYLTAAELLAYLREAFNPETRKSDYSRLNTLAKIPVLCIDEMDKLRDTQYSREIQQELINLRYRDAKFLGTVLAWNGGIESLPFPAVASRASEFTVVNNADFHLLFPEQASRQVIIVTFLAILELVKMKLIRIFQMAPFETIRISPV